MERTTVMYKQKGDWSYRSTHGFLIKGKKSEYRLPCFALATENVGTYIING